MDHELHGLAFCRATASLTTPPDVVHWGIVRSTVLRVLRLALALGPLAGCGGDDGPSVPPVDANVAIVIDSMRLLAVSSEICHVQGTARNTSDQDLGVVLRFQAFDAQDRPIATTGAPLSIVAGTSADFETTGFFNDDGLVSCARIARFERILEET
jgi:hypothetical protein